MCRDVLGLPREWESKTAQGSGSWPWDGNSPDIIKAIGWLKHDRIALAHPIPVVLQEAEEKIVLMKHIYPGCQFGIIKEFIGSSMRAMLEKGGPSTHELDFTFNIKIDEIIANNVYCSLYLLMLHDNWRFEAVTYI